MRIILFGNGMGGSVSLEKLSQMGHDILVVCPPGGKFQDWHESILEKSAQLGVECIDPEEPNEKEVVKKVKKFKPDVIFSILYHKILSREVLSLVEHSINFHPSLLPSYRGTAPLIWAMVNGEREVGITAHQMNERVDMGDYYARVRIPINPHETGFELHNKVASKFPTLVSQVVEDISNNSLKKLEPLDLPESVHTSKTKYVNHLNPRKQTKARIHNIVRALAPPLPPAWIETSEGRMQVFGVDREVSPLPEIYEARMKSRYETLVHEGNWYIFASDGLIQITDFSIDSTQFDD